MDARFLACPSRAASRAPVCALLAWAALMGLESCHSGQPPSPAAEAPSAGTEFEAAPATAATPAAENSPKPARTAEAEFAAAQQRYDAVVRVCHGRGAVRGRPVHYGPRPPKLSDQTLTAAIRYHYERQLLACIGPEQSAFLKTVKALLNTTRASARSTVSTAVAPSANASASASEDSDADHSDANEQPQPTTPLSPTLRRKLELSLQQANDADQRFAKSKAAYQRLSPNTQAQIRTMPIALGPFDPMHAARAYGLGESPGVALPSQ